MARNEFLIFRILQLIKRLSTQFVDERRLLRELARESSGEYSTETILEQLDYMGRTGLVRQVQAARNQRGYALDWAGYDYLDAA
ncbi:hypothetical protein OL229_07100 [Neisseriaceae bacterium JH1-16]|jgi:hypothetical protein|nr:hypothetical protein [Neisseriaceae bacterium JH1-16]